MMGVINNFNVVLYGMRKIKIQKYIMFFGNPQQVASPIFLQSTGQLTVHMAHPTQNLHLLQSTTHLPTFCPSSPYSQPTTHPPHQYFQQGRQYLPHARTQQTTTEQQKPPYQQAELQSSMVGLQEKVEKMEKALSGNTAKINEETLLAFDLLRNQLSTRLNPHNQAFQRTHLAQLEKKWDAKAEQQVKAAQVQLETAAEKLKTQMQHEFTQLLEHEKAQAEKFREQKFEQVRTEIKQQEMEQVQILQGKLKQQMKEAAEEEEKAKRQLEERLILRIKEESEAAEVLTNKVVELQEKTGEIGKNLEVEIKQREKEKQMKKKEKIKKISVDMSTPFSHIFNIHQNIITYQKGVGWVQVLLDAVLPRGTKFVFSAQITHTHDGYIIVGVVDRHNQAQQMSSYSSGNAVCYSGYVGCIYYGQKGECKSTKTGIPLQAGTEVEVEVELDKGTVAFILHQGNSISRLQQSSDILAQSNRLFVPYFQMGRIGDSIRWAIK